MQNLSVVDPVSIMYLKVNGEMYQGRPKRLWLDDLKEWAKLETYTDIKRTTEEEVSGDYMQLCTFKGMSAFRNRR